MGTSSMASISTESKSGRRTIQFVGSDEKRRSIRLGKVTMKDAEAIKTKVEAIQTAKFSQRSPEAEVSVWIGKLEPSLADRLAAVGLIEPRQAKAITTCLARCRCAASSGRIQEPATPTPFPHEAPTRQPPYKRRRQNASCKTQRAFKGRCGGGVGCVLVEQLRTCT